MLTYLENLTIRLATAVAALPESVRESQGNYLLSAQRADGGFAGREGESDLYYTTFALRSLAVLGLLDGKVAEQAYGFLAKKLTSQETVVDFLSLIYGSFLLSSASGLDVFEQADSSWKTSVVNALEGLRRDDGGYSKGPEGAASSTYHTFLVVLCLQLLEVDLRAPEKIVDFLHQQRWEGGGFREIRASKRAGTNPTAAAIGTLSILNALDSSVTDDTIDFLVDMQTDEGGLRANTRIPIADLLSTFTGTLTLLDLEAVDEIDLRSALRYAESMRLDGGGYHGAVWDENHDVEYTFYGIGAEALLHQAVSDLSQPLE